MDKQILFIHSAGAQGKNEGSDGLVSFLLGSLGEEFQILAPGMPNPDYPEYASWKARLKKEFLSLKDKIILIGHSLGGSILIKYLSEEPVKINIEGLFLIATPYWGERDWEIEEFELENDFNLKLPKIPGIFLYQSLNDQTVPYSHMKRYAEKLPEANIREFGGNDHAFDTGIPELIRDIKKLNKNGRSF